MKRLILTLLACTALPIAAAAPDGWTAPALPTIPDHLFKVSATSAADLAPTIQSAIDAAAKAGGGTVELPPGEHPCGPLKMASHVNLRLPAGCTLKLLPIDHYPGGTANPPNFIDGESLTDVAITGDGTIDGQGAPWWPLAKTRKDAKRPRMIALRSCDRVLIERVHLKDSPMFHIAIGGHSSNVTVRGVNIRANPSTDPTTPSHNTDACDVSGSHILIEDCDVSVGDDNFTCGGGTSDVLIRRCTYGYGHGVSIGSYTRDGVSNLTVEDCTFANTECGIRIKSDRDRGGDVHHLTYRNLKMTNVGYPILVYAAYNATEKKYRALNDVTGEVAAAYPAKPLTPRTPRYHDLTFSHITATAAPGKRAGLIWGLPEAPVTNVLLEDVEIHADKPFGLYQVKGVRLDNCRIVTPDGTNKLSTAAASDITLSPR